MLAMIGGAGTSTKKSICLKASRNKTSPVSTRLKTAGLLPRFNSRVSYSVVVRNCGWRSDFFDFTVYVDADTDDIRSWYVERFLALRNTAFQDPSSYFHRYARLSDAEAAETAGRIWAEINEPNLRQNIQPTRERADLILRKGRDHAVEEVRLRKL